MSIRVRLLLGFSAIVLMSGLASAGAIHSVSTLGRLAVDMYDKPLMAISFARSAQSDFAAAHQALLPVLEDPEPGLSEDQFDGLEFDYETFVEDLEVVAERTYTDRSRALTEELTALAEEWWTQAEAILDGTGGELPAAIAAMAGLSDAIEEKLEMLVDYESENGYYFRQDAESAIEAAWWINIGAGVAILVLGALIAFVLGTRFSAVVRGMTAAMTALASGDTSVEIPSVGRRDEMGEMASALKVFKDNAEAKTRLEEEQRDDRERREQARAARAARDEAFKQEIDAVVDAAANGDFTMRIPLDGRDGTFLSNARRINRLTHLVDNATSDLGHMLAALASGDLTQRMTGDYQGRFLQLKEDANRMGEQVASIAEHIAEASGAVQRATQEIGAGVGDLAHRTEHQASSLEETTGSMEELSATVRQNAENAQEANQVATTAREAATNGGEVAGKAVAAMGRIEESSRRITDIVGLIQEIAFQTNLLALNAAVEAARAGDAGTGFAVVATEVRALAQRSGQASKDIKELIVNSDNQIRDGVELVNEAGVSLEEIVTSVTKAADFVSEIAAASHEQSSGIDQVSRAINTIDKMTQQNGALAKETTAALQLAQARIADLREVVTFFKTDQDTHFVTSTESAAIERPLRRQQCAPAHHAAAVGEGTAAAAKVAENRQGI